jgi:methylenetetrahydrofolate dehydrogenase (NADP+) / methenyltetrahydrofolate cyclohydrolase
MGTPIDGKQLAEQFRARAAEEAARLQAETGVTPGLGAILLGEDPASKVYVRSKERACEKAGIFHETYRHPGPITTAEAVAVVESMNRREDIHGILVQLPLPAGCDEQTVLSAVNPDKDVDGFHTISLGRLLQYETPTAPCTPKGILEVLKTLEVTLKGANAVIVGRSLIVGKPMALLLLHHHATVTICHSRTKDLAGVCRQADILVAAVGRPLMITADFVKEGATVIDVGINRVGPELLTPEIIASNPAHAKSLEKSGYALVGDVAYHEVLPKAGLITPVPGGVGPLTIAMLLQNTVTLAREWAKKRA